MPVYALSQNIYPVGGILVVGPTGGYPAVRVGSGCYLGPQYGNQSFVMGHYIRAAITDPEWPWVIGTVTPANFGYRAIELKGGLVGGGIYFYALQVGGVLAADTVIAAPVLAATLTDVEAGLTGGGNFILSVGSFQPGTYGNYNAVDGSVGVTTTFSTADTKTITVKNGIITGVA